MTIWLLFLALVFILLGTDLYLLSRSSGENPTVKDAIKQTSAWVSLGLLFTTAIYYVYENDVFGHGTNLTGAEASMQYLTGYLIEQALSVDNLFVIAIIMAYFKVPQKYQYKILFWGILGVLVMRGLMIGLGYALVSSFSWINYVFGAILLWSAYKMATTDENEEVDFDKSIATRIVNKFIPIKNTFEGGRFFIKTEIRGKIRTAATTLFLALMIVETTDVMFAFDSVPAVFSVTKDPFLVFSSNIFAILGLRSLYFVLAASMEKFEYLETALVIILGFIGLKLIAEESHLVHIPVGVSLGIVIALLAGGVIASLWARKKKERKAAVNKTF
jgi:tellurite resistance protein TerC